MLQSTSPCINCTNIQVIKMFHHFVTWNMVMSVALLLDKDACKHTPFLFQLHQSFDNTEATIHYDHTQCAKKGFSKSEHSSNSLSNWQILWVHAGMVHPCPL